MKKQFRILKKFINKYISFDIIAMAIYGAIAIMKGLESKYDTMAAYIVVITFLAVIMIKNKIIENYREMIKLQNRELDNLLKILKDFAFKKSEL